MQVRDLMTTLKENLPEVYTALIQERDEYMANSLIRFVCARASVRWSRLKESSSVANICHV